MKTKNEFKNRNFDVAGWNSNNRDDSEFSECDK